jgi:hypothetical protein
MIQRLRANHAVSWAAIGLAAATLFVACFVAAFELRIEGYTGGGDTQRSFDYLRTIGIARDSWAGRLVAAAALVLVVLSVLGVLLGSRRWLVIAAFAMSAGLAAGAIDTDDRLGWPGDAGTYGYESPHGGPLLQPALDDLKAEARSSPEARDPGWQLSGEHSYAARGLDGWRVALWAALALVWLTGYRLARLLFRPWASVWIVVGGTFLVFVWLFLRALGNLE